MPGVGIRTADMKAEPPLILDVSRLVSRIGTGPLTGIDRVEAAWLAQAVHHDHLLLCRIFRGQALLPPEAGPAILRWVSGDITDLPARPGWRERLARRRGLPARASGALRSMALVTTSGSGRGLGQHIARHLSGGKAVYLNVGHSNLTSSLLSNLSEQQRVVMIHDTIPLDYPEFTRAGQSDKFRTRLMTALSLADMIVTISDATATDIDLWRRRLAIPRTPKIVTAHIGTTLTPPDDTAIPPDLDPSKPYFVTLGTIEPRKNHALLLDAWDILSRTYPNPGIPRLLILGRRGWENHDVLTRLDNLSPGSPVIERGNLPDGAVAALISHSHGLLMPSRAEGFGLPLTEAAGRGIPVVSAPLPAAQELLGDYATYLSPNQPEDWARMVTQLTTAVPMRMKPLAIPSWDRHFHHITRAFFPDTGHFG
ncbi:MAG: glycosyltransferase family 4 protein [Paracoccus sp. (in: a-proteobacteria)]